MPDDLADLDPDTQQFHVKMRAAYLMALGTALVLIFSGTRAALRQTDAGDARVRHITVKL